MLLPQRALEKRVNINQLKKNNKPMYKELLYYSWVSTNFTLYYSQDNGLFVLFKKSHNVSTFIQHW